MNNWSLTDTNFDESLQLKETLFSTANGYLGVRGNFEEGVRKRIPSVRELTLMVFMKAKKLFMVKNYMVFRTEAKVF